jgi:hypothetical protein
MSRVQGVECPKCFQRIWSQHRHDMRYCFCGYAYVDGGHDYLRMGWGGPDWPKPWAVPKQVRIRDA